MCKTFHCLPSELDEEDPRLMDDLAQIDIVVESKVQTELKKHA